MWVKDLRRHLHLRPVSMGSLGFDAAPLHIVHCGKAT